MYGTNGTTSAKKLGQWAAGAAAALVLVASTAGAALAHDGDAGHGSCANTVQEVVALDPSFKGPGQGPSADLVVAVAQSEPGGAAAFVEQAHATFCEPRPAAPTQPAK